MTTAQRHKICQIHDYINTIIAGCRGEGNGVLSFQLSTKIILIINNNSIEIIIIDLFLFFFTLPYPSTSDSLHIINYNSHSFDSQAAGHCQQHCGFPLSIGRNPHE